MGASGGFPIDLILFGMIAAFLVLRLKSILGKRTGYERPPQPIQPREAPIIDATGRDPRRHRRPITAQSDRARTGQRTRPDVSRG